MIDSFRGEYFFLSNFYPSKIEHEGVIYLNNESAFQASKTTDIEQRLLFCNFEPNIAKQYGRKIKLREDWEKVKVEIMYEIVKNKFIQNSEIKQKLINTHPKILIEGNNWRDTFWGIDNKTQKGSNMLGKILMKVREELIKAN